MSIVAISASELAAVTSEKSNSVMLGHVLTLELTFCKKVLGLEFSELIAFHSSFLNYALGS